jgi:biotin-(acetyl-CoA carboxylase) ligase
MKSDRSGDAENVDREALLQQLAKEKETLVSLFLSNAPAEKLTEQYARIDSLTETIRRWSRSDQ